MFRYSVRPGTTASRYSDDVPEAEKIERLNMLIKLQRDISYHCNQREVGRIDSCIIEGPSRRDEKILRARTTGNKTVLLQAPNLNPGDIIPVKITAADAFTLHGEVVS